MVIYADMWEDLIFFLTQGLRGTVFLLLSALVVTLLMGVSAGVLFFTVSMMVLAGYLAVALCALGFLAGVGFLFRDHE